jgi:DNA-binding GntR family transcriptional regulator
MEAAGPQGGGGAAGGSHERPQWSTANDLFHEGILEASGNARLAQTIRFLHRGFPRNLTWSALSGNTHLLHENVEEHSEILRAIEKHDSRAARKAMTKHIRRSAELVTLRFEQLQASAAGERQQP